MKKIITFCLTTFSTTLYATDVSPYVDGQNLSHTQAKELQQRYNNREQQAWKKPDSAEAIKKHNNAELIQYGIQNQNDIRATGLIVQAVI
jgi:hypothetical protein